MQISLCDLCEQRINEDSGFSVSMCKNSESDVMTSFDICDKCAQTKAIKLIVELLEK